MIDCPTCDRKFDSDKAVKIHHTKSHGESIAGFEYNCAWCGNKVIKNNDVYEKAFCSDDCRDRWQSENFSGKGNPNYQNAQKRVVCNFCNKEFYRPESQLKGELGKYCSHSCKGKDKTGEDSPVWKDINSETEKFTKQERRKILERDEYTCQDCGKENENFNAHHIIPTSESEEKAHDIDNGVTLCIECHASRHEEPVSSFILAQDLS